MLLTTPRQPLPNKNRGLSMMLLDSPNSGLNPAIVLDFFGMSDASEDLSTVHTDDVADCYNWKTEKCTVTIHSSSCCLAGLKTKEKEKTSVTSRPPTRRGAHSVDQPSPASPSTLAASYLCHPQLPS